VARSGTANIVRDSNNWGESPETLMGRQIMAEPGMGLYRNLDIALVR